MAESAVSTSLSLIARVQAEDGGAWGRFVSLYAPVVYGWARRARLQDSDAADVVQDVFLALSRDIQTFQNRECGASFRRWLWGVTRHKLLDTQRQLNHQPTPEGGSTARVRMMELPDELPDDPSGLVAKLAGQALNLIQVDFQETTWRAFWRVTIDGEAPAYVASDLQMSVGAVYQAKYRVLTHLRSEFEGLLA
jgi:RNA polymerase sigma-70 factor (ECF subfamily)